MNLDLVLSCWSEAKNLRVRDVPPYRYHIVSQI